MVLKGLLNSGDADALAAAVAERQFLAEVEHPLIVEIYNFVMHEGAGYIVMEYVGGKSLKEHPQGPDAGQQRRSTTRSPVDQAIAYVLEVLPAFSYLHDLGLLYCDFKPDNVIQIGDAVKLIDLGGVRRIDDDDSAIYGTVGYQAPEVAEVGPFVASDIYTIGRTLTVLVIEFRGYQSTYVASLPPVADTPVLQTVRLALPAAAEGLRARPGRPVRPSTSCACSCSACSARSSPRTPTDRPRTLRVVGAVRGAGRRRRHARLARDLPALRVDDHRSAGRPGSRP